MPAIFDPPKWFEPNEQCITAMHEIDARGVHRLVFRPAHANAYSPYVRIECDPTSEFAFPYEARSPGGITTHHPMSYRELRVSLGIIKTAEELRYGIAHAFGATHAIRYKAMRFCEFLVMPGPNSPDDTTWRSRAVSVFLSEKMRKEARSFLEHYEKLVGDRVS